MNKTCSIESKEAAEPMIVMLHHVITAYYCNSQRQVSIGPRWDPYIPQALEKETLCSLDYPIRFFFLIKICRLDSALQFRCSRNHWTSMSIEGKKYYRCPRGPSCFCSPCSCYFLCVFCSFMWNFVFSVDPIK